MIEDAYTKDNYESNLLVNQLRPITDIFNIEKTSVYIIDSKEKLEIIKKLIGNFGISQEFPDECQSLINEYLSIQKRLNKLIL